MFTVLKNTRKRKAASLTKSKITNDDYCKLLKNNMNPNKSLIILNDPGQPSNKKVKFSGNNMFKFILWNDSSCRDSEIEALFQNTNQLQFIGEAVFNINSHNFAPGQKRFISTLKRMNIVFTSNFSDIEPLMNSIMNLFKSVCKSRGKSKT